MEKSLCVRCAETTATDFLLSARLHTAQRELLSLLKWRVVRTLKGLSGAVQVVTWWARECEAHSIERPSVSGSIFLKRQELLPGRISTHTHTLTQNSVLPLRKPQLLLGVALNKSRERARWSCRAPWVCFVNLVLAAHANPNYVTKSGDARY